MRRITKIALFATAFVSVALELGSVQNGSATTTPPTRFVGTGSVHWVYPWPPQQGFPSNQGSGSPLHVVFDSSAGNGTAAIEFNFPTPNQAFFDNVGQVTANGDWVNGWTDTNCPCPTASNPNPAGEPTNWYQLTITDNGDGSMHFNVQGWIPIDAAQASQGPWYADGNVTVTRSF